MIKSLVRPDGNNIISGKFKIIFVKFVTVYNYSYFSILLEKSHFTHIYFILFNKSFLIIKI